MTTTPIRVLVVDDHLVTRRGLATLLLAFSDIMLVGEAQNGAEALELCAMTCPDVILMDLVMPKVDGAEATRAIHERYPDSQVIVLTSFDELPLVQRALNAGAKGILLKQMIGDEMAATIRRVYDRRPLLAPKLIDEIVGPTRLPTFSSLPPGTGLTERECEVLALMARGLTNPQIGMELIISRATAKAHVSSILSKLGVATRTEAVALAVQSHLTARPGLSTHHLAGKALAA